MPSRSPATSSAGPPRSPTSTSRRSWSPTSSRTDAADGESVPRQRRSSWPAPPRTPCVRPTTPLRNFGFPYRSPTVPRGVEVPPEVSGLGAHYDTDWARRPARVVGPRRHHRRTDPARRPRHDEPGHRRHRPPRRPACAGRAARSDLRADTPQPLRHRPDDPLDPDRVATQPRRRRGSRLLLRQEVEGGDLRAVAQRDPDRS